MLDYNLRDKAIARFENGERTKLFTKTQPKGEKAKKYGWLQAIMHLSPADLVYKTDLCPAKTRGCYEACLNHAGRGNWHMVTKDGVSGVHDARSLRTIMFEKDREGFMNQLRKEIEAHIRKAENNDLKPVVRLNGTSDFPFWKTGIMEEFAGRCKFIDYTKNLYKGKLPDNYEVCFSRAENNETRALQALANGQRVSVVFEGDLPKTWNGYPVHDGDKHDLIFLHPKGVVLGLKAKGTKATIKQGIESGFILSKEVKILANENKPNSRVLIDRLAA